MIRTAPPIPFQGVTGSGTVPKPSKADLRRTSPFLALKRRCLYGPLHAGNLGHSGHRSEGISGR